MIFTNTYFLDILFEKIGELNFQNIKIISSQTDHLIDKKIFLKKPDSVSYWYSKNVNFKNEFLKSIPLGLANKYSPKNLHKEDYKNIDTSKIKIEKIYVNFEKNTNYFHRNKLIKSASKNDFSLLRKKSLAIKII